MQRSIVKYREQATYLMKLNLVITFKEVCVMKKILSIALILCCLLLTACNSTSIGIIGGADGPTKIYVGEKCQVGARMCYLFKFTITAIYFIILLTYFNKMLTV